MAHVGVAVKGFLRLAFGAARYRNCTDRDKVYSTVGAYAHNARHHFSTFIQTTTRMRQLKSSLFIVPIYGQAQHVS